MHIPCICLCCLPVWEEYQKGRRFRRIRENLEGQDHVHNLRAVVRLLHIQRIRVQAQ